MNDKEKIEILINTLLDIADEKRNVVPVLEQNHYSMDYEWKGTEECPICRKIKAISRLGLSKIGVEFRGPES